MLGLIALGQVLPWALFALFALFALCAAKPTIAIAFRSHLWRCRRFII